MKAQAKLSVATRSGAAAAASSSASLPASSAVSPNSVLLSWTKWRLLPSLLVAASCLAVPLANAGRAPAASAAGEIAAVVDDANCVELIAPRLVESATDASVALS